MTETIQETTFTAGFAPVKSLRSAAHNSIPIFAFEEEYASKHNYVVTTDTFLQMIVRVRPSLTEA